MAKRPSPKSRNRSGARSGRSATLGRLLDQSHGIDESDSDDLLRIRC